MLDAESVFISSYISKHPNLSTLDPQVEAISTAEAPSTQYISENLPLETSFLSLEIRFPCFFVCANLWEEQSMNLGFPHFGPQGIVLVSYYHPLKDFANT